MFPETETASSSGDAMLPAKVRRTIRVMIGGGFVDRADKVLGRGKTHFLAALAGSVRCDQHCGAPAKPNWCAAYSDAVMGTISNGCAIWSTMLTAQSTAA